MKHMKRTVCLLICCAMLAGYIPAPALAEVISELGLCEHHREHIGCAYIPAAPACVCNHVHDEACYVVSCAHEHGDCGYVAAAEGVDCDHIHDAQCGYMTAADEISCTCGQEVHTEECAYAPAVPGKECTHIHGACSYVEAKDEVPCAHECTEDAICSKKVLNCSHIHDNACGYAEAVEGVECDFICAECATGTSDYGSEDGSAGEDTPIRTVTDGNVASGTPDGDPPVLQSITLSASAVNVPAEIEVIVKATDEVAGLSDGMVYFECKTTGKRLSCGVQSGHWEWDGNQENWIAYPEDELRGILRLDQYVEDGEFIVYQMNLSDNAKNSIWYYRENGSNILPEEVMNLSFTVSDTVKPDTDPPILQEVTLSAANVKVPEEITVTVYAEDEVSGLNYGEVRFFCEETGKTLYCYVDCDYWDGEKKEWVVYPEGELRGTLQLDQYVEDGKFIVQSVHMRDKADNQVYYYRDSTENVLPEAVKAVSFVVEDTQTPDSIPPVLKDVAISVKKINAPGYVEVTVYAEDEVSGLEYGRVYFTCDETGKTISCGVQSGYWEWDGNDDTWIAYPEGELRGTMEVDQYVETGTFTIRNVELRDIAENNKYYHQSEFPDSLAHLKDIELYIFNTVPDVSTSVSKPSFLEEVKNAAEDAYIAADYSGNATMPKDVFDAIAGTDKVVDLVSDGITWRFEGSSITEETKDVDLNVQIRKVEEDDSASGEAIEETLKNNPGIVMEFPANGTLPGKATIQLKVDYAMREYLGSETGLYVYYYNNQTGKLELVEGDLRVVNDTYVEFTITHCSYYILTTGNPKDLIPKPGGSCGANLRWEYWEEDASLRFYGTGAMENYASEQQVPWYEFRNVVERISFEMGATTLSDYAFSGFTRLTDIRLPSTMRTLGRAAFQNCTALTSIYTSREDINLLGNPAHLPPDLFRGCTSLTSVQIPRTVTKIHKNAFRGCTSLDCLDIPGSVKNIGYGAFADCTALSYVLFEGQRPGFDSNTYQGLYDAFEGTNATVYYRSDLPSWDDLDPTMFAGNITWVAYQEPASGMCGPDAYWQFDAETGALIITGTGEICGEVQYHGIINRETKHCMPWYAYRHEITSVWIYDGITEIGSCTFHELSKLHFVSIGDTVKEIAAGVFENCNDLRDITFSEGLKTIGNGAFSGCANLRNVMLPASVSKLGKSVFGGCGRPLEIVFRGDAPTFDENAFGNTFGTAQYLENNSTWKRSILRNYGGSIRWEAIPLTMYLDFPWYQTIAVGETVWFHLNHEPYWFGFDPVYTVGGNAEIVQKDETGIGIKALAPGRGIIRVTDATSQKSDVLYFPVEEPIPIAVSESKKVDMGEYLVPEVFTFTPTQSGQYAFTLENIDDPYGYTEICISSYTSGEISGEWLNSDFYSRSRYSTKIVCTLEAGESYLIRPWYFGEGVQPDASLRVDTVAAATGLDIPEGTRTVWLQPDGITWVDLTAALLPGNAIGDITWTCDDTAGVLEEMSFDGPYATLCFSEQPGTVVVTAACGDFSDSITITTKEAPKLTLNVPVTGSLEFGNPHAYSFVAQEEGTYCLRVDSDAQTTIGLWDDSPVQDGCIVRFLEKGEVYNLTVAGATRDSQGKPYTVTVTHTDPANSVAMTCRLEEANTLRVSASFEPETGYDWIAGTSCNDESILQCVDSGNGLFRIRGSGKVTLTLTTGSGLTATETIYVGKCGQHVGWMLDSQGTMTVYGFGMMQDFAPGVWQEIQNKIQIIRFEGSITHLPLDGFQNTSVREIYLPASLMDIYNAFGYSTKLEKITIPEINRSYATRDGVLFSKDMKTLLMYPIHKPDKDYTIPDGVMAIEYNALKYNTVLQTITIPNTVTRIGSAAFEESTALKHIVIPASVTEISENAFMRCTALETVVVEGSPELWGTSFAVCTALKEISFLGDAPSIVGEEIFSGVTAAAYYPAGNTTWTSDVRQNYGGNITWVPVHNQIVMDKTEVVNHTTVWIDGVQYPVLHTADSSRVMIADDVDVSSMVTFDYHMGDAADVHTQYPVSMKVWVLEKQEDGSYKANRVEALDDVLQYSGSSIRITGNKGIRMITSVPQEKKNAMVSADLAGYKLLEYGTVLAQVSKMADGPLVLGAEYAKSNYAYKKGVADPVFAYAGDLAQYTNVLVGFTNDQCKEDIAMRPYMILENEKGEQITLYGGIVYRSIGYIAYQNRSVFAAGSAAYNYVWEIIHHVYGDKYDAEYKG